MRKPTLEEVEAIIPFPDDLVVCLEEDGGRYAFAISRGLAGQHEIIRTESIAARNVGEALLEARDWLWLVVQVGHYGSPVPGGLTMSDVDLIIDGLERGEVVTGDWNGLRWEMLAEAVVRRRRSLIFHLGLEPAQIADQLGWAWRIEAEPAGGNRVLHSGFLPCAGCSTRTAAVEVIGESLRGLVGAAWLGPISGGRPQRLPERLSHDYQRYCGLPVSTERRQLLDQMVAACPNRPGDLTLADAGSIASTLAVSGTVATVHLL